MAVIAAGCAIMEPRRNHELAELAVAITSMGNVEDKVHKNHRKTLGLLRDLRGACSVGVIAEGPALVIAAVFAPLLSMVIFPGTPCRSMARSKNAPSAEVISLGAQKEVDGVAIAIDHAVQRLPLAADVDVGLVHSPVPATS